jgi:predicted aldo/keto reductase-like oxidoreductase
VNYSEFGKTGIDVSAVGFGGMRFDMNRSEQENADVVKYAFGKGINYFDSAIGYFDGKSEAIIGRAVRELPRDEVFVTSKGMPTDNETAAKAMASVDRSLHNFGLDHIDFYHVWCLRKMAHYDLAMQPGGQYEGLLEAQRQGKIRHIVFSSHQPGHEIRQILHDGHFKGVLMGVNILNFPYRWDGVTAAAAAGCGVVAMNPLAGGAIPQNEERLKFLCRGDESPTEAAIQFLVGCPDINVALIGFTTTDQINLACRAEERATPYSDEDLRKVKENLTANMDRICTGCGYCQGCPQHIPVSGYLQIYNDRLMFGADDEKMRNTLSFSRDWGLIAHQPGHAAECVECGVCEEKCTQHLPIIERLRELASWEGE